MNIKNFYRKYRPTKFKNIYGQNEIITILKEQVNTKKTHFAYLFTGVQGVGKTSTARILSRSINCLDNQMGEPCEKCSICIINNEQLIDIYEIDAASNNGVEQIRILKEKVLTSPSQSRKKIYIIDEVHMLSKSAYNAFLKLLEEPPSHIVFILATTQLNKIPETILSRCQIFEFRPLKQKKLKELLIDISKKEGLLFEEEAIEIIVEKTKGSVREALNILEQTSFLKKDKKITSFDLRNYLGIANSEIIVKFIMYLIKKEKKLAFELIETISKQGVDLKNFFLKTIYYLIDSISNKILEKEFKDDFLFEQSILSLKIILDIFLKRYFELNNLNLSQVLKLIILEHIILITNKKIPTKSETILYDEKVFDNKKKEFNLNFEEKVSISKCIEILNDRNKDILDVLKINWTSLNFYLENKEFGEFAKLLYDSKIISSSKTEFLIKAKNEEKSKKINILRNDENFLNFINKILEKKNFIIYAITKDELKIVKKEFHDKK